MEDANYKWYQVAKKLKFWWWKKRHAVLVSAVKHAWEQCGYCGNSNEDRMKKDYLYIRCLDCNYYWDDPYWQNQSAYQDL